MGQLGDENYDLKDLKDFARKYFRGDHIRSLVQQLSEFHPDCSFRTIATDLLRGEHSTHVIEIPMISSKVVDEFYKTPGFEELGVWRGPALRPPFVKLAPDAQEKNGP